jgi:hypothetical protein
MSTTAPLSVNQAADLVDRSIQKIFSKTSEPEAMYKKYFNFRTTEDLYEKDSGLSGLGIADFVDENAAVHVDVPIQTFDKTYTQVQIEHMVSFTKKMYVFGIKRRDLDNKALELKRAIARKREQLCAEYLDNGFESTSYSHSGIAKTTTVSTAGGDTLGPWDDDHTREDGGTNMNNYVYDGTTYNLPLDYAGLKAAYRTMSLFVDPRGNKYPANLTHVVVKKGSSAHFKAMEILGAIKRGRIPESTDNDAAAVGAFEVLPLDYLSNAAYWWAFDSSRALSDEQGLQFVESQAPSLLPVNVVYKTGEIQQKVESMSTHGHNDVARSWVASKGDSSSPSD